MLPVELALIVSVPVLRPLIVVGLMFSEPKAELLIREVLSVSASVDVEMVEFCDPKLAVMAAPVAFSVRVCAPVSV